MVGVVIPLITTIIIGTSNIPNIKGIYLRKSHALLSNLASLQTI
jgi:hypothetical protein